MIWQNSFDIKHDIGYFVVMVIKEDEQFEGIPTKALKDIMLRTIMDAAFIQAAGLPLPEFKVTKREKAKDSATEGFRISNVELGEYLRVSSEITQMADDLRKKQLQDKGPKSEP